MTTIVFSLHFRWGATTGNPHENECSPVSSHVAARNPTGQRFVQKPTRGRQALREPTGRTPETLERRFSAHLNYELGTLRLGADSISLPRLPAGRGDPRGSKRPSRPNCPCALAQSSNKCVSHPQEKANLPDEGVTTFGAPISEWSGPADSSIQRQHCAQLNQGQTGPDHPRGNPDTTSRPGPA